MELHALQLLFAIISSYFPVHLITNFCDRFSQVLERPSIHQLGNCLSGAIAVWIWWHAFVDPISLTKTISPVVFFGVIPAIIANSHKVAQARVAAQIHGKDIRIGAISFHHEPQYLDIASEVPNTVPAAFLGAVIGGLMLKFGVWMPLPLLSTFFHQSVIRWVVLVFGIFAMLHYCSVLIKSALLKSGIMKKGRNPMEWKSLIEIIVACLVPLFPTALLGYSIGGGTRKFSLGSMICGFLGAYLCWHAGMAGSQVDQFSPLYGIIPAFLAGMYSYLQHLSDFKKQCISSIGDRFTLADGSVVRLPKTTPLLAILISLATAFVISQIGTKARMAILIDLFHNSIIRWILIILGLFFFLSLAGLSRLLKGPTAQRQFSEAKALHENTVRGYSHELKPEVELESLRKNPQLLKAHQLYLSAVQVDKNANYGSDNFQQLLNQSVTYCQLALLHRQWQKLEEAAMFAKKAYEALEPYRLERSHDLGLLSCLSTAYFRFAETMHVLGNKDVAWDYYQRSLKFDEELNNSEGKQQTLSMLKELGFPQGQA